MDRFSIPELVVLAMIFSFELMNLVQCGTSAQHRTRSGSHFLSEISEIRRGGPVPAYFDSERAMMVRWISDEPS